MQWRRRHCCTHAAKLLYLLSLLGLLVFLVHQVWLPQLIDLPWWRGHPVVFGGEKLDSTKAKSNVSTKRSTWHFVIVPQQTVNTDNHSSVENIGLSPLQEEPVLNSMPSNSTQTEPQDLVSDGPFAYILNEQDKCSEGAPAPFLVLLIATEARQVEARNAIRQTWGNESVSPLGFVRLFLLGKKEGELGLAQQKILESESRRHHDIIQQNFLDSYKNLTVKTMMGINWVAKYCSHAAYVMKTDSDMFVNTEYLIQKLLRPDLTHRTNYFTGNNMRGFAPNRNKNSKWYMPPESYPGNKYPTFCSGTGYVFSGDLAKKIYRVSQKIRYLHLEDVYVGVCLAQIGIEPTPPPNEFLFNHWRVSYSSCKYSHLITSHGFHPNELLKYWHHLQSNKHNACINALKDRMSRTRSKRLH